jgi:transposase
MHYIGLDVHKRVVEAAVLDEGGQLVHRERFPATREALERFAKERLTAEDALVLEATTNTWAIVAILQPHVGRLLVSNPLLTRAIAQAKVKTDRIDARVLAQLLRAGYLPEVWIPDEGTRALRELTQRRAALVAQRTAIKNRIHAILHQRLLHAPLDDLFAPTGRRWLATLDLDAQGRSLLDAEQRLLASVEHEIQALSQTLAVSGHPDPRVRLLLTLPGVDLAVAITLLAALGDIGRFRTPDHAASYLGLVPSTRQSAEHCYHGPITKRGRSQARFLLVQAAQHLDRHPGPLGVFFRRLAKKKNRNVAVVATARKLVTIAWHVLTSGEPYRYAKPRTVETKLARLRVAATGSRRRGGVPKGTPRSAHYGTGDSTRTVPSLDDLCAYEGLPPLQPLARGEARMLRDTNTEAFANSVRLTQRVPRRASKKEKKEELTRS